MDTVRMYSIDMNASNPTSAAQLENLHPSLWRASQLGRAHTRCIDTGHLPLSQQLAGGGWPTGTVIELLLQQAGVGELRLLGPALAQVAKRKIMLIQPPHPPQIVALASLGIAPADLVWVKTQTSADYLFATDQALRSGSWGAVLLWTNHIRQENLRRLTLAASSAETLCYVMRPLSAAQDASPSPLRLSIRPAPQGVEIGFVKRRGSVRDEPLFVHLPTIGVTRPLQPSIVPAPAPMPTRAAPARTFTDFEMGHS